MENLTIKTMRGTIWVFLGLSALGVLLLGCKSGTTSDHDSAMEMPVGEIATPTPVPNKKVERLNDSGKKELAQGDEALLMDSSHAVFGLKIPMGMMPLKTPPNSYIRYAGTHSVTVVRRYIASQLVQPVNIQSIDSKKQAYIIKDAKVKSQTILGSMAKELTIRLYVGSLGGATIDIWDNQKKKNQRAVTRGSQKSFNNFWHETKPEPWEDPNRSPESLAPIRSPRAQKKAFFKALRMANEGKSLSELNPNNPFFY